MEMKKDEMEKLMASLHPLERKVLPVLKTYAQFTFIVKESGLQEVEVMRALQWLQNKSALIIDKQEEEYVLLDENGVLYQKQGLPERRLLNELEKGEKT